MGVLNTFPSNQSFKLAGDGIFLFFLRYWGLGQPALLRRSGTCLWAHLLEFGFKFVNSPGDVESIHASVLP